MFDILNKRISIGDYVVAVRKGYRDMVLAKVLDITPKQFRVVYPVSWTSNLRAEVYLTSQIIKLSTDDLKSYSSETLEKLEVLYQKEMSS